MSALPWFASAQQTMYGIPALAADVPSEVVLSSTPGAPAIVTPPVLPRMGPELALQSYQRRSEAQATTLEATSDTTIITAELPDTRQSGHYELKRLYQAPKRLAFSPLKFIGDGFVKSNIIVRLLQSEVDHVEKGAGGDTSISERNYKFNYKGVEVLDGETLHVFHVKPRKKRAGLFKGRILINPFTGSIRRAEGTLVKSPSIFIKKIEFVQDYADINGFTFPVHLRSICKARVIGRAIVDIFHQDYQAKAVAAVNSASADSQGLGGPGSN